MCGVNILKTFSKMFNCYVCVGAETQVGGRA